ncbi:MFS transporter OS=Streptomyces microflavus OX=1919 GN=Smic_44310 PE=4 SV=1 [Streptomyces microflavus]
MMVMSPVGAKLSAAKGPKVTLAVGSLLIAAGYGLSVPLIGSGSPWSLLIVTLVCNWASASPTAPCPPSS